MSAELLQQLYSQVLGREPDPAGFAHNLALLESGAISPAEMANAFASSQEAQSNTISSSQEQQAAQNISQQFGGGGESGGMNSEQILNKAYQDVFGRSPDPSAQGWLRDINAGLDLQGLKNILATTPEARNKALEGVSPVVGENDPNNFVSNINQLYMSSLGRLPDKESLVNNLNLLNQNPDAFGWLSQSVTGSEEAKKYAEKTGIDQDAVYNQVTGDYGKWTPAASSPTPGGLGGFFMKAGPYLPFALAAGALAAPYLTGAGAAGGAAGTAASAAEAAALLDAAALAEGGVTAGMGAAANTGLPLGTTTLGSFVGMTPEYAAELGLFNGSALGTEGAAGNPLAGIYGAETSLLSSLGSVLSTPLGRLGAMGGLSLLSGGGLGSQQQQPVPQMAGGGGTYAPRGQVDYTPILNLLAPRQISRNSLLG